MKRPKLWRGRAQRWPHGGAEPQLSPGELKRTVPWPLPAHTVVRFPREGSYFVDVELAPVQETVRVNEDSLELRERWVVTGIAVRRGYSTAPQPAADWSSSAIWDEGAALEDSVSARDMRRMPIASLIQQAIAIESARTPGGISKAAAAPPGTPARGTLFYRELADSYRAFAAEGRRPVHEIARRKRVSPNLVHQWVLKAREHGFLEESPYSGKRRREGHH